ncbi:DEAD/DEAH box helicase, partial [Clostridium cylindrosporum]|uniref:RNA helicase n=1 Tax=Clostridium cylindrosporum DSM 605 TaxID=1121307 RepID=A0A0J8DBB0_CLOCY
MSKNFSDLGVNKILCERLKKTGIVTPTEVQEKVIPLGFDKKDIVVESQTGTGKTLAFLLPILQSININKDEIQSLIITPTRELAAQITQEVEKLSNDDYKVLSIFGGQDVERQIRKLKSESHIVVGTPGRILYHVQRKTLDLSRVRFLVIDEADQMLNMGFIEELNEVIKKVNPNRRTMLFSATVPKGIRTITLKHMKSPSTIRIKKKGLVVENISQISVSIGELKKEEVLEAVINKEKPFMSIVFCKSKDKVKEVFNYLFNKGYLCDELHGDLTPQKRRKVMKDLKDLKIQVLVASDIACRGLDVEGVTHIINYDIPREVDLYVHRIGRTGRAGQDGIAITLVEPKEQKHMDLIEKSVNTKVKKLYARVNNMKDDKGEIVIS